VFCKLSLTLGMIVTRLAWMAHMLVSSKSFTRNASADSCSASIAFAWKRLMSEVNPCAISRTWPEGH